MTMNDSTSGQPAITRDRLESGMTYDAYVAQMTKNREAFEENERGLEIGAADLEAFSVAPPLSVLVLTEDWCGDAVANLPILGRIARESGRLDLRIFLRDENEDLRERYRNGEYFSIPVFVFFDQELREVGRWIERPAAVSERRTAERTRIYASDPRFGSPDAPADQLPPDVRAQLQEQLRRMREEMRPFAQREVVRELREIVERAA